jgi:uncharacterized integral membrane protein
MRLFYTLVVIVIVVIVAAFAWQNFQTTTIALFKFNVTAPLALIVLVVYLLGMLTGGSVVAAIRRAVSEATCGHNS